MKHYNDLGYGGNHRWLIEVNVWPHSTGFGRDVEESMAGPRLQRFVVKAGCIDEALELGKIFVAGVRSNPVVWECWIGCVRRAGDDEDCAPVAPCVTSILWDRMKK